MFTSETNNGWKPACSSPSDNPPHPANRSIKVKFLSVLLLIFFVLVATFTLPFKDLESSTYSQIEQYLHILNEVLGQRPSKPVKKLELLSHGKCLASRSIIIVQPSSRSLPQVIIFAHRQDQILSHPRECSVLVHSLDAPVLPLEVALSSAP